ncbi:MAG: glycosyltransferase [Bacteroidia bacterium]
MAFHGVPYGLWVHWAQKKGWQGHYLIYLLGADILEYTTRGRGWADVGPFRKKARRLIVKYFLCRALREAKAIFADSYTLVAHARKLVSTLPPTHVLSLGVDPAPFTHAAELPFPIPENKILLVSPRGATYLYQADYLLQAYEKVLARGVKAYFLVMLAGLYGAHPTIAATAQKLQKNYPENFLFYPHRLSAAQMATLWQNSHGILSFPSYDSYAYSLAEARYAGNLPIVNGIEVHHEILTHGYDGWIIEPFDADRLAQFLIEYHTSFLSLRARMAPYGRAYLMRHDLTPQRMQTFLSLLETYHTTDHV